MAPPDRGGLGNYTLLSEPSELRAHDSRFTAPPFELLLRQLIFTRKEPMQPFKKEWSQVERAGQCLLSPVITSSVLQIFLQNSWIAQTCCSPSNSEGWTSSQVMAIYQDPLTLHELQASQCTRSPVHQEPKCFATWPPASSCTCLTA
ncbi:uncharacterized protein [Dermacentor albipictus]|uniref:uncharacterized protein n=1 Tax=Dermacentor albipictus TaxID=60249 RepID=UPI0038FC1879